MNYGQQQSQSYQYESVQRTQVTTVQGGDTKVLNAGLTDVEGAKVIKLIQNLNQKAVARRLFDTYDRDRNGQIDNVEVVPMIVDVYKSFNRIFSPSRGDIDSFFKVLDRNSDGRITYQDLEDLCVRYLTSQAPTTIKAAEQKPADTRGSQFGTQPQPVQERGSQRGSNYQAEQPQQQQQQQSSTSYTQQTSYGYRRPQQYFQIHEEA